MNEVAESATLADVVCAQARPRGDSTALEFEGRQASFKDLDLHTSRVAKGLRALGVQPLERVAYLGKNSDIYFELLLGAIKANVVVAPVNSRLAGPEIAFIVETVRPPCCSSDRSSSTRSAAFRRSCQAFAPS
jgi:acyl-CoA synthetase (AMP-forming)/AMP-acid ligase II